MSDEIKLELTKAEAEVVAYLLGTLYGDDGRSVRREGDSVIAKLAAEGVDVESIALKDQLLAASVALPTDYILQDVQNMVGASDFNAWLADGSHDTRDFGLDVLGTLKTILKEKEADNG